MGVIEIKLKTILYIGNYNEKYSRNWIILRALKINGIKVYTLNFRNTSKKKMMYSIIKNLKILNSVQIDLIYFFSVTPRDWPLFLLTKFYSKYRKIPMVYDYFISKFQTFYEDRELFSRKNKIFKVFKYVFLYCLDYFECLLSNSVVLDTDTHIEYFKRKYKLKKKKFVKIFVGARDDIYFPLNIKKKSDNKFIVGYWGTFIPLHGVDYIIKAFELLKNESDIYLSLLGKGQTYETNKELAERLKIKNIEFIPKIFMTSKELNKLPEFITKFDLGLGIFGSTNKMLLVIPNKIFEGIAMKLPMITANTPAIREEFTNNKDIILCDRANPESLAKSIIRLKNNEALRKKIANGGYLLYKKQFSIDKIGLDLVNSLNEILTK